MKKKCGSPCIAGVFPNPESPNADPARQTDVKRIKETPDSIVNSRILRKMSVTQISICSSCRRALLEASRYPQSKKLSNFAAPNRTFATSPAATFRPRHANPSVSPPRTENKRGYINNSTSASAFLQKRAFSLSRQRRAVILNPRKDEEGKDMEVEITPRAAKRLREIMKKDANPNLCLRVQVESGGCHGFQYLMSLTDLEKVSKEEDTVFESGYGSSSSGAGTASEETAKVVMDEPSLELLKGSKVDYTMELIGSQFKIVDNPLASSSCGCGTSFDIKM
ncbi:hypothetical protein NA57DRAFT_77883 [Rhizodiscina lignyota]|uniref:Core domain-containing protein n=1 Tax=Rhizodiscina lignyota TaxID=1504668 RepID=A0A9P4M5B2_9PEZI|nr:hypothetical protein NA57DRAFT_77883 [Rhizodiscina lignyota]